MGVTPPEGAVRAKPVNIRGRNGAIFANDGDRLPLLQRHRHRPAAMNLTPNSTGAPEVTARYAEQPWGGAPDVGAVEAVEEHVLSEVALSEDQARSATQAHQALGICQWPPRICQVISEPAHVQAPGAGERRERAMVVIEICLQRLAREPELAFERLHVERDLVPVNPVLVRRPMMPRAGRSERVMRCACRHDHERRGGRGHDQRRRSSDAGAAAEASVVATVGTDTTALCGEAGAHEQAARQHHDTQYALARQCDTTHSMTMSQSGIRSAVSPFALSSIAAWLLHH